MSILERLVDFDRSLTATERYLMRMEAWQTIRDLRAERDKLALQVLILTNERDEARASGRIA